ncbi:NodT family efflux transporter outer membrane factor (OMF) lipoprotein [Novosphingobium sp. PhB165]|uniref:efflux transporter outer membrane subunit n=1 Tax=Novosphingobium sp. PhB165 TaxID=2485105 RepID=UPI0010513AE4|nr:TolC family protein [Novosphingobium sp. PhB165]TCM20904.1 NodT family efflux transporter outer membrane factor (OMF) lipoprotein [Novosphingobium sp. PhB165]
MRANLRNGAERAARLSVSAIAVLLCGCAPQVHLPQADTALPPAFEANAAPAGTLPEASLDRWWESFRDPQLSGLIDTALARSTTARLAYARLSEARATRSVNRASTLPTGSLSATATEQGTRRVWGQGANAPGDDSYQATFYPSWEIDLFGRLSAIRQQADVQYASSTLDWHGARLALAADVATTLFQARGTAIDLGTARERLKISTDLARSAQLGEARGLTSGQDAARLDADLASASAEVTRLEAELQAAKRSLLILVGTPNAPTDSLPIEARLDDAPTLPAVTPGLLLARRPDVLSAGLAVESAALGVRVNRLALFPRFDIQPGLALSATTGPVGGATGLWSLAAGLTVPLLDRTRLMAQLRVSEAQGQQAVVSYEQTVQNAYGEAENALVRLTANRNRIADLERAEARSRAAYDSALRGYRAGLTDLTTVLQSEQTWLQARAARDQGRLALLTGTVSTVRALGGGWDAQNQMPSQMQTLTAQGAQ